MGTSGLVALLPCLRISKHRTHDRNGHIRSPNTASHRHRCVCRKNRGVNLQTERARKRPAQTLQSVTREEDTNFLTFLPVSLSDLHFVHITTKMEPRANVFLEQIKEKLGNIIVITLCATTNVIKYTQVETIKITIIMVNSSDLFCTRCKCFLLLFPQLRPNTPDEKTCYTRPHSTAGNLQMSHKPEASHTQMHTRTSFISNLLQQSMQSLYSIIVHAQGVLKKINK